ncbi:hypothetical protein [Christiangramia aquimixticola]|uniref:AbiTii domain-containing protein n=1 Tax=Christiangramia aquimixticola TaxID=1697558 RepID=UPI003AA8AA95
MKLLSDIINELVDSKKSITSPMLKTKVLATRINNSELLNWVNNELKGYDSANQLPDYRIYKCHLSGNFINAGMKYTNNALPTTGLSEKLIKDLNHIYFFQSISGLETTLEKTETSSLEQNLSAELISIIEDNIRNMGNPFYQILSARKTIAITAINEIISIVRNKLLDFTLKVDEEFGNLTEIKDLKGKNDEITTIMNKTIINNSGDGNVINTGNKANFKPKVKISKGNKSEVRESIKEVGLSKEDADKLIELLSKELPNTTSNKFGNKVNRWIQNMIGKSLDGSWEISVSTAGGILTEIIKKYYGM